MHFSLITGLGIGTTLNEYPKIQLILSFTGGIWLSYIGWKIFNYRPDLESKIQNQNKKNGFFTGFFLQFINPKSWLMAIAVITVYTAQLANYISVTHSIFIHLYADFSTLFIYLGLILGKITKKILSTADHIVIFNRVLGTVLLISVWYPILHAI